MSGKDGYGPPASTVGISVAGTAVRSTVGVGVIGTTVRLTVGVWVGLVV
jgi:hypothetical protein